MRNPCILYLQRLHLQSFHMLLHFLEISPVMQITKRFRGPAILVWMSVNDYHIAAGTYHATQFIQHGARADNVMEQHMAHGDIDRSSCQGKLFSHTLLEGD